MNVNKKMKDINITNTTNINKIAASYDNTNDDDEVMACFEQPIHSLYPILTIIYLYDLDPPL